MNQKYFSVSQVNRIKGHIKKIIIQ